MKISVNLQNESGVKKLPLKKDFKAWITAAILENRAAEIAIRLVSESESAALNAQFRGKNYATNVLSFPYECDESRVWGDLAICPAVVMRESAEQGKSLFAHFAHLTIHGSLHLQGFDHETESDAEIMESLEIQILEKLGIANPYE